MDDNINKEKDEQHALSEFENEKPTKKPLNSGVQVLLGVFFIFYGVFRLSNTISSYGSWNTFFGWTMIILGVIRIGGLVIKK